MPPFQSWPPLLQHEGALRWERKGEGDEEAKVHTHTLCTPVAPSGPS